MYLVGVKIRLFLRLITRASERKGGKKKAAAAAAVVGFRGEKQRHLTRKKKLNKRKERRRRECAGGEGEDREIFHDSKKKKLSCYLQKEGNCYLKAQKTATGQRVKKKKRRLPPSGEERENRPVSSRFLSNARQINARRKTSAGTQPIFPTLPREFSGYRRSILFFTFFFLM